MAQVLANLITNALRFTPAGGAIRLGAHAVGDQIAMSVADNGQGIDPADLPFVFERFWRADRARTRSGGGSGLGLAIARRIVEAHGGTITADSAPGTGTTITILMPLTQPGTPQ
jgi:signal transduction histidine kinase